MAAYYNEIDRYAAQWLRNLIAENLIAKGEVDERSITEVQPGDLAGFDQCHLFAGIGGWSLALRLAGWPDDRPVWTGSCPCQPFSVAGKRKGFDDERHLWPIWRELIRLGRPPVVFGEQVASASEWLRIVRSDLEAMDCAVGALPIQAACAGAFHYRDRYFFVADSAYQLQHRGWYAGAAGRSESSDRRSSNMANSAGAGPLPSAHPGVHRGKESTGAWNGESERCGGVGVAQGDANHEGPQGRGVLPECVSEQLIGAAGMEHATSIGRREGRTESELWGGRHATTGAGGELEWVIGADGKARPVKPGIRLLAHGVPARVGKLRAFGNAIYPQVAAEFIKTYMEISNGNR